MNLIHKILFHLLLIWSVVYTKYKELKHLVVKKAYVGVLIGLAVVIIYVLLLRSPADRVYLEYNPFTEIGLTEKATDRQIRSTLRKLRAKNHPDRVDPSMRDIAAKKYERYQEINDILTNPERKKNYLETGHPDGKPEWDDEYPTWVLHPSKTTLFFYALLAALLAFVPCAVLWFIPALKTPPIWLFTAFENDVEEIEGTLLKNPSSAEAKLTTMLKRYISFVENYVPRYLDKDEHMLIKSLIESRLIVARLACKLPDQVEILFPLWRRMVKVGTKSKVDVTRLCAKEDVQYVYETLSSMKTNEYVGQYKTSLRESFSFLRK
mmetsp:Transcript_10688/g.15640  ORF Transcript_10688/g.15640 Transcript_10688/m.15640 type:complete len:322 (-) Transcript_10688:13-978(-)